MSYSVLLGEDARAFLSMLDERSERICTDNLAILADEPYPGRGRGDKEGLVVEGEKVFRLHIGRTYTACYVIDEDAMEVRVFDILPIGEAHDRYGWD